MDATALAQRAFDRAAALATNPRAPGVASVALVAVLAWQLALVTWGALPATAPAAAPEQGASVAHAGGDARADGPPPAARLAQLHLFGTPPTPDAGAELAAKAPETVLDLTLMGVYAAESGGALAIIAAGGRDERVYGVGDHIAGNARIIGIFPTRVLLRRNGQAEVLRMDGRAADIGALSAGEDNRDASAGRQRTTQRARELRRQILNDPASLTELVRFEPATRGGQLVGYRIVPRSAENNPLAELGLKPGDILTRLNGIPLDDPRQASRALASLRDARRIEVRYLRGGSAHRLSIPIGAS